MQKTIDTEYLPAILNWVEQIEQVGDIETAQKAREVLAKLNKGQLYLGFCGHFSAGKSTFINRMLGQEILPTSPVPTSANVVSIASGEDKAVIQFRKSQPIELKLSELENLKSYCRDGEEVEKVEITSSSKHLAPAVVLLDTPGVDSTDPQHQQATAAALHLADIIFFITDYNHVQSEHNYLFLKELQAQGKPILFVVNQIDKHQEEEISIQVFREGVEAGLRQWGLEIKGLFFTSLKQLEHPANQWQQLMEIYDWINSDAKELSHYQAQKALQHLLKEHRLYLQEDMALKHQELFQHIEQLEQHFKDQNKDLELETFLQWRKQQQVFLEELEQESVSLIDKAELISYQVTQKAKAYLESAAPQFKVGLLFAKKKTEEERQQRLEQLHEEIYQQCQTQIEWHIKQRFQTKLRQIETLGFSAEALQQGLADWRVATSAEQIKTLVNQGAVENSQYVYQFTKELAQSIKQSSKRSLGHLLSLAGEWLAQAAVYYQKLWESDYTSLEELAVLYDRRNQLEAQHAKGIAMLQTELEQIYQHQPFLQVGFWAKLKELRLKLVQESKQQHTAYSTQAKTGEQAALSAAPSMQAGAFHEGELGQTKLSKSAELIQMEEKLRATVQLLDEYPALHNSKVELQQILSKCEERRYTMAIFGAFSAGKSSFINALLGKRLMPVSPHPTTAAIIKVMDGGEALDGKAKITFKQQAQLEKELRIACARLGISFSSSTDLASLSQQLERLQAKGLRSSIRPYYTYLKAMLEGWAIEQDHFGEELIVDEATYQAYAAVETKACFVEQVECYHSTPWTKAGLQIIDTPGADSIFARHTNVTFQFMKEADIVIYLTYYNHAFSHADQDILGQLEKVKEKSQLDHMYFIINAADLAQDDRELDTVKQHVHQQLARTGIATNRLYAVSSLKAMQGQDQSFSQLSSDLALFVEEALEQLMVAEAEQQIQNVTLQLEQLVQTANQDQALREQRLEKIEMAQHSIQQVIEQLQLQSAEARLTQELAEQRFYIEQRLQLQLANYFNEAFNPAVLQGRSKEQVVECLQDFLHAIQQRLNDEWKTSSLRLQAFLQQLAEEWIDLLYAKMLAEQPIFRELLADKALLLQGNERATVHIPALPNTISASGQRSEQWKELTKLYSNAKHFFEENGKQIFKEKLEVLLSPLTSDYQKAVQALYKQEFERAWNGLKEQTYQLCLSTMSQQLEIERALISGALTEAQLIQLMHELKRISSTKN